jgi:hypothetical protein
MSAPQLPPGSVVAGKYSVGQCLGYGGSSATYHAAGADGREVALKIFDPAIRQRADIMAALEQTYAATNALPQDVAVPLLDAGYDPGTGAPFSVTERISYPSLAQLVGQRPLTPEEVTSVLAAMARVLDQAHARQLSHHALKPTNIFVGFTQGFGVKITDFGAGLPRAAVPTQEGYALSAPWLAPEQVQGGAQVGPAADVFATALVTFFALTGRSYWHTCQGTPDLAGWQREIMSARAPASARALQLGVTLNSAFDAPLGTALALDPSQRYRSIGEFANAIESIVMSRGPESSATMAFPSMGLLGGGEYPPPPAPMGGYGAPPTPAAGYGAAPPPAAGQPAQAQPAQPPQGQGAGYVATQTPPVQPQTLGDTTAAGRPIEPGALRRPAGSPNRLAPILVGVVALLLVGGGVAAWIALGRSPSGPETVNSAAPSASAAVAAAPSGSESAAPAESAAPSAAPEASGAPSAAPSAEPAATGQEVALTCEPACDELKIDDKVVDTSKPILLEPGKHTVVATKADFKTLTETINVEKGKKLEKKLKLQPAKVAAAPGPGPGPGTSNKQPCGKILKRCK